MPLARKELLRFLYGLRPFRLGEDGFVREPGVALGRHDRGVAKGLLERRQAPAELDPPAGEGVPEAARVEPGDPRRASRPQPRSADRGPLREDPRQESPWHRRSLGEAGVLCPVEKAPQVGQEMRHRLGGGRRSARHLDSPRPCAKIRPTT